MAGSALTPLMGGSERQYEGHLEHKHKIGKGEGNLRNRSLQAKMLDLKKIVENSNQCEEICIYCKNWNYKLTSASRVQTADMRLKKEVLSSGVSGALNLALLVFGPLPKRCKKCGEEGSIIKGWEADQECMPSRGRSSNTWPIFRSVLNAMKNWDWYKTALPIKYL